jgi:hypothetical protein
MTSKDQVDVPRLRKALTKGSDKLPLDFSRPTEKGPIFDRRTGLRIAYVMIVVLPSVPKANGRKSSTHRIWVLVPNPSSGGTWVPVGRLMQSNAWKEYVETDTENYRGEESLELANQNPLSQLLGA